jgi:uncharacterized protein
MKERTFDYPIIVITGRSSDIGACFLASIIKLEQKVIICNLSRQKPKIFEGKEGCYHFECDLSKREAIEEAFCKIQELLREKGANGRILLINNGGLDQYGEFQECDLSTQLNMIDLNVCAIVHLTRLILPLMMEQGGAIINIASIVAFQPTPRMATYGATQAFILNWSMAIREELKKYHVRVLALCPGAKKSNFLKRAGPDLTAEEVVEVAWKALKSNKGYVISGFRNKIMAFVERLLPLTFVTKVAGTIFKSDRN